MPKKIFDFNKPHQHRTNPDSDMCNEKCGERFEQLKRDMSKGFLIKTREHVVEGYYYYIDSFSIAVAIVENLTNGIQEWSKELGKRNGENGSLWETVQESKIVLETSPAMSWSWEEGKEDFKPSYRLEIRGRQASTLHKHFTTVLKEYFKHVNSMGVI